MNDLVRAILERGGTAHDADAPPVQLLYGVVTDDSPLTVQVGAAASPVLVPKLASYTATIGDYVAVLVVGADRLVIGEVG